MWPLTLDDLDWVLELTRRRRESLAAYAPLFWRPALDAAERHREFLANLVADQGSFGLRTGGPVLLVTRVESAAALAAIESEAAARGATVSVISQTAGDDDAAAIARSAGYVETTFFMER